MLAAAGLCMPVSEGFADSFDWRNVNGQNWVTSVKDQGNAGTCWDFAGCGILEAKYMLTRNDLTYQPDVSEQQLLCAGIGTISGGNAYQVDNYAISTGVVLESELPYTQQNTSPLWPLPTGWTNYVFKSTSDNTTISQGTNINTVKNALKTYGPLTIHLYVPDDWYNLQDSSGTGNHEVVLVGYHDNVGSENAPGGGYWIVKNSWGATWNGDGNGNGYGEIAYSSDPSYFGFFNHTVTGDTGRVYFTGAMATVTWTGGASGAWTQGGNLWSGTDMHGNSLLTYTWDNSEASATFDGAGSSIPIIGPVVAHGVTISSGATGYSFSGFSNAKLTVTSSGITAHESVTFGVPVWIGAPQSWNVDAGKTLTIGGDLHTIISNLTLNGNGDTTITGSINGGGVLNDMGDAAGTITKNGTGTLHLTGSGTYSVPLAVAAGSLSFEQVAGTTATFSGVISGSGTVTKSNPGTVILSGANSYTGPTRIMGGALQASIATGVPNESMLILDGGVLQSNGAGTYTDSFKSEVSGNRCLSWLSGGFAGGAGKMTVNLRGNGSVVNWTGNGDTGIAGNVVFGSSVAQYEVEFKNALNLNAAERTIYVEDNPNSTGDFATISGVIANGSGTGWLTKTGPGRLVLTGANTYGDGLGLDMGATRISAGVLQADRDVGLSPNSALILNGGVLQSNSAVTFSDAFYSGTSSTGRVFTWIGGGFAAGGGKMTVNVGGSITTLKFGDADGRAGIAGTMKLSSTSAQYETEVKNAVNLNGAACTVQVDDNPNSTGDFASLSGVIGDSVGGGTLTAAGTGVLYIKGTASNSYAGLTAVRGTLVLAKTGGAVAIPGNVLIGASGTTTSVPRLILNGSDQIAPTSVLALQGGMTTGSCFELLGNSQTLAGISGGSSKAIIENSELETGINTTGTLTIDNTTSCSFAGRIRNGALAANGQSTGLLALVKSGSGTLTLGGYYSSDYTGGLTVNSGLLDYSTAIYLPGTPVAYPTGPTGPTSPVVMTPCPYTINGGTLKTGAQSASIGAFKIIGGTVSGTATLTSNANYDVRGGQVDVRLAGNAIGLTKSGSNTAVLTGANTYTGRTTVTGGSLVVGPNAQNCVLSLGGANIQTGALVFDYNGAADPAATIAAQMTASYHGGLWDQGQFQNSTAVSSGLTLGWQDDPSSHQVKVMATYAGDFNLDGIVNDLDKAIWFTNAFIGNTWQQGDANYDGVINGYDRDLWFAHAGMSVAGGMASVSRMTPVPEPGSLALLAIVALGLLAYGCQSARVKGMMRR